MPIGVCFLLALELGNPWGVVVIPMVGSASTIVNGLDTFQFDTCRGLMNFKLQYHDIPILDDVFFYVLAFDDSL